MEKICLIVATVLCVCAWAQDEEETEYTSSCSLSIKTTVFPPETADRSGRGYVEASLSDKNGIPVTNKEIKLTVSCGTLSCQLPGWYDDISSISSDRTCFTTGADGKIQVYLINVPFNTPGKVKATSSCGELTVSASSTFKIMRTAPKKKTGKK